MKMEMTFRGCKPPPPKVLKQMNQLKVHRVEADEANKDVYKKFIDAETFMISGATQYAGEVLSRNPNDIKF